MGLTAGSGLEAGLRLLGVPWPDEDEQALREVAAAYRAFADTLDTQAVPTMTAGVVTAAAAGDGDDVAAMRAYTADYHREGGHLTTLASLSRLLADGHEQQGHDAVVALVEDGRFGQDALAGADAEVAVGFDSHHVLLTR